ncbi:MAG: phosphotransferase family protein [Thermoleophilaceae bacterium]
MSSAIDAAVAVAAAQGLGVTDPVVLQDGSNVLVHLRPAPIVARVPAVTARFRNGDAWLAREVAVAGFLHDAGAPVVPPASEIPPGPHAHDGHLMTFFEYAAPASSPVDAREAGRRLRLCHEALRAYPGELPRHALLEEARALVDVLELPDDHAERLRAAGTRIRARLDALDPELRPVHGDGDLRNVIQTERGPLWNDWEDACLAPVAWDLACLHEDPDDAAHARAIAEAERGYGVPADIDPDVFDACVAARRYQETVWTFAFLERHPQYEKQALEMLDAYAS